MQLLKILPFAGYLFASLLALSCSGNAEVVKPRNEDGSGQGKGGRGGVSEDGRGGVSIVDVGQGGEGADSGNGDGCKKTCEADDCGPIADGCGQLIECGGCVAPQTCGGGGEASKCGGEAACEPKTCEELGKQCGIHADGCGDVVDCWGDAPLVDGEAQCAGEGEQCVDGECRTVTADCDALTCDDYQGDVGQCGPVSDGCGGTLDCGFSCAQGELCGAEMPGQCGTISCMPQSCEQALSSKPGGFCGFVADGCGGEVEDCAQVCSGTDTCGGGGTPDVCGTGQVSCTPKTIAACGTSCGPISDGCGGVVQCGGCTSPDTCGGGGEPGVCGSPTCQPRTCSTFGAECGSIPDGCGATLNCGSCGANEVCNTNQCDAVVCVPKTTTQACTGFCGQQSNGCGGAIDCGGCTAPNTCGGGGTPSVCGAPACTPRTCQQAGANCGPIGDGCGGIIASCGTCASPQICGGSGTASVCGASTGSTCTGLCESVEVCSTGQETRLTGTVYAPNGSEPMFNALVYVPNKPLPPITTGPSCERCQDEDLGEPIAAALTGPDGKFVLRNVPAGVDFPLVVKMGKWRRVVTMTAQTKCTNRNLTVDQARLPRSMTDATVVNRPFLNIPRMAMVTGDVDELECVLRKIGVADSEFTLPSGTGRIHLYRANGANAGCTNYRSNGVDCRSSGLVNAPLADLFSGTRLDSYDLGIFGCEGDDTEHNGYDAALRDWANRGGRVFASHYSYTYLHDNGNFASTATWGGPQRVNASTTTGILDTSFSKGQSFNTWLGNVNAWHPLYGSGYIQIQDPRDYVKSIASSSERFVYTDDDARVLGLPINQQDAVQQFSFNTPVGAAANNICGRVLYSAFHVADASGNSSKVFPAHCSNTPLTPQEKVLEFMLFDLSACVSTGTPPTPPSCTAKTCAQLGANCGAVADGCGGLLTCGTCAAPNSCGGGGISNQCGTQCKRTTCGAQGANCGIIADGCGGTLDCGTCTSPAVCGGGGTANVCGTTSCKPRSCADVGAQCGPISDGCGSTVNCGTCPNGTACGGGGTPNVCGAGSCNPKTCATDNAQCGFIGDGCGGTVACGTCATNQTCGSAGPNQCGGTCSPRTCAQANASCGFVGDGCGGVLSCGSCVSPQICGGGGTASQCGGTCTPRTCAQAAAQCGAISDGCGGVLSCGTCPTGSACGAGGVANQCGTGSCTPRSCAQANAECGLVGDGCNGTLSCGTCVAPKSCGGAGVPNQCGTGTNGCVPRTCAQQNADCGPVADGCGNLLDCGSCSGGETCGGGGTPSRCGGIR